MTQSVRISLLLAAILLSLPQSSLATPQNYDSVWYKGTSCDLLDYVLEYLWLHQPPRPKFDDDSTANRKNYVAGWQIRNSQLFLVSFNAKRKGKSLAIEEVIPGSKLPVLATWYTGKLHIGMGEVVGWDSGKRKYERLRILDIEKGVVTGWTEELRAAKADPR